MRGVRAPRQRESTMPHSTRHDRRRFLQGLGALVATGTAGALFPQLELIGQALAAAPRPATTARWSASSCTAATTLQHADPACAGGVRPLPAKPRRRVRRDQQSVRARHRPRQPGTVADGSGKNWGCIRRSPRPNCLFDSGELAFLANIGSLVEPLRKSELAQAAAAVPVFPQRPAAAVDARALHRHPRGQRLLRRTQRRPDRPRSIPA